MRNALFVACFFLWALTAGCHHRRPTTTVCTTVQQ